MLSNESKIWDKKYESSREYESLEDFLIFSKNNPTISALSAYAKDGLKILEIGSGTGELISFIKHKYPGVSAYGMDYSSVSVKRAKNIISKFGLEVFFIEGDIEKMPFDDNSFDIVFGDQVLGHVGDINIAVSEIKRVLKPGGLCFVSTVNRLRFDGWDLYKTISKSHFGYTQRSFYPWEFKKLLKVRGFSFQFGYGDMLILIRNFKIIKEQIIGKKNTENEVHHIENGKNSKGSNSILKRMYNYLDKVFPWFLKVSIGVVFKKYEN